MAMTVPTAFSQFQYRLSNKLYGWIVKLTDGTSTWYFGNDEMQFSDGTHVYGLLTNVGQGIKFGSDPPTRNWSIGSVQVSIANKRYRKNSSGNWVRPSADLSNIINKTASIYLWVGPLVTSLNDCFKRFEGKVAKPPSYDQDTIVVEIIDDLSIFDTVLPQHLIGDIYTDAPSEYLNEFIPLLYGTFIEFYNSPAVPVHDGAAKGIPCSNKGIDKTVFADHTVQYFYYLLHQEGDFENCFVFSNSMVSLNENDSGRATAEITDRPLSSLYVRPSGCNWYDYYLADDPHPVDENNAFDETTGSYCTIKDSLTDAGGGGAMTGAGRWHFELDDDIFNLWNKQQSLYPTGDRIYFKLHYKGKTVSGPTSHHAYVRLIYQKDYIDVEDTRWPSSDSSGNELTLDDMWRTLQITTDFGYPINSSYKNRPYLLEIFVTANGGDGTVNNQSLIQIDQLYIEIATHVEPDVANLWAMIYGRMFGSWIDSGGRSNSYDSGDVIYDMGFIIESLLREEIGLGDSEIDTASFDLAEDTTIEGRMNLTQGAKLKDIIRQLCEQSRLMFFYTATEKARLIRLHAFPSTSATVPFSHILSGEIKVDNTELVANYAIIESQYRAQKNEYRTSTVIEDTLSQSLFGVRALETNLQWPNVTGTSKDNVATFLFGSPSRLLSSPHPTIEFETFGIAYAHLQIGDIIELDDETVDPHLLYYGSSWSGVQFMVIELDIGLESTRIKAMKLS